MRQGQEDGTVTCPECGTDLPAGALFCLRCGARQSETQEHAPAPTGSDSYDSDVGGRTVAPSVVEGLGAYIFYGPSLWVLTSGLGVGLLLLSVCVFAAAPVSTLWLGIPTGLALCALGLWSAQTGLDLGTEGFRYSSPLGSTEIRWDQVSKTRARYAELVQVRWIEVSLFDGTTYDFGYLCLSDGLDRISDQMEDCLSTWRRHHPTGSTGGRSSALGTPSVVMTGAGARRPLRYGLSVVALVAVVGLGFAWRSGVIGGHWLDSPTAPQTGHWAGAGPAIAFEVGPDGQVAHFHATLADRLGIYDCGLSAAALTVAPGYTIAGTLEGDGTAGLLRSEAQITGTFYGKSASGTYRLKFCAGQAPVGGVDGTWSAEWQSP